MTWRRRIAPSPGDDARPAITGGAHSHKTTLYNRTKALGKLHLALSDHSIDVRFNLSIYTQGVIHLGVSAYVRMHQNLSLIHI